MWEIRGARCRKRARKDHECVATRKRKKFWRFKISIGVHVNSSLLIIGLFESFIQVVIYNKVVDRYRLNHPEAQLAFGRGLRRGGQFFDLAAFFDLVQYRGSDLFKGMVIAFILRWTSYALLFVFATVCLGSLLHQILGFCLEIN
jgi:hypothetical protein